MPMLLSCLQAMPEAQIFLLMSYEQAQKGFFLITFFFWTTSTACVLRLFMWSCCQAALQRKVKRLSSYRSVLWGENWNTPDSKVTLEEVSPLFVLVWVASINSLVSHIWDVSFLRLRPPAGTHWSDLLSSAWQWLVDTLHSQMQPKIGSKLQPILQRLCSFIFASFIHFSGTIFEEENQCILNEHFKN